MADSFGVKVSLPGFNAETAADQDLYFNSSWPLLKIDEDLSGTMTITGTASDQVTHNLGYPPFVLVWATSTHANPTFNDSLNLYCIDSINSTTVSFRNYTNGQLSAGDKIRYYIFRNPLNVNFLAPNIQLAQTKQGTNKQDFGLKFAKPNKNTSSTDLRDYTIHSGTKSLQVHQVAYGPLASYPVQGGGTGWGFRYITDLPYRPVHFGFYSSDNINFIPVFAAATTFPKISQESITGADIIVNGASSGGWGVWFVLLNPYQSTNQVNITL